MKQSDVPWLILSALFIATVTALPREIPEEEVPAFVLQRFKLSYPEARNVHYKDEHFNPPRRKYEVSFEINGRRQKTMYSYDGLGVVEDRED